MQRSSLAKWALTRRMEAHLGIPALFSLVLVVLAYLGPESARALVSPGLNLLPGDRAIGLGHLLSGLWMAWTALLSVSTLTITRQGSVRLLNLLILAALSMCVFLWLDGHSLTSRLSALWLLAANEPGGWSRLLAQHGALLELAFLGAFSLLCFVLLPLLLGGGREGLVSTLVPSRWLALTTAVMFGAFYVAFRLQGQGWGTAGESIMPLVQPVFFYMLMLHAARMQYRSWVKMEADRWNPSRRS